jgi:hypothetical protein
MNLKDMDRMWTNCSAVYDKPMGLEELQQIAARPGVTTEAQDKLIQRLRDDSSQIHDALKIKMLVR